MAHIRSTVHSSVRDQNKTIQLQGIDRIPHGCPKGQMVQCIAREHFNGNGNPVVIQEQPHLYNGLFPVFFADAHFPKPFFYDVPIFIESVFIGFFHLKEKVRYIIEHCAGIAPYPFGNSRIHPLDDLLPVLIDDIQCIINIILIAAPDQWLVIAVVLPHGCYFRVWFQDSAISQ